MYIQRGRCAAWALALVRAHHQKKSHIETRFRAYSSGVMQKCVVLSASEAAAPELSPHFSMFYSVHLPRRWRIIREFRRQQRLRANAHTRSTHVSLALRQSGPQLGAIFRRGPTYMQTRHQDFTNMRARSHTFARERRRASLNTHCSTSTNHHYPSRNH